MTVCDPHFSRRAGSAARPPARGEIKMALVVAPGAGAPKTPAPPPAAKAKGAEAGEGVVPNEAAVGVIAPPPDIKGA